MKTRAIKFLFFFLFCAGGLFRCQWTLDTIDPLCPVVIDLDPKAAVFGEMVTITGANFLPDCPDLHVILINGNIVEATILEVPNDKTLRFKVPSNMPCGALSVGLKTIEGFEGCGVQNSAPQFAYQYPEVTKLDPIGGAFDDIITITGTDFLTGRPDLHAIYIDGKEESLANIIEVPDETTLRFKVGKGMRCGALTVVLKGAGGNQGCTDQSTDQEFTYYYTAVSVKKFVGGPNSLISLIKPTGINLDKDNNLWVTDMSNAFIYKFDSAGNLLKSYGQNCVSPTPSDCCISSVVVQDADVVFQFPNDVLPAMSEHPSEVYIASGATKTIHQTRQIGGAYLLTGKCGKTGSLADTNDKDRSAAVLSGPVSMAKDNANKILYFTDNGAVKKINIVSERVNNVATGAGNIRAIAFSSIREERNNDGPLFAIDQSTRKVLSISADGTSVKPVPIMPSSIAFSQPVDLTLDEKGNIFVSDESTDKIYVIYRNGYLQVLADGEEGGFLPKFDNLSGLAFNESKKILYVADSNGIKTMIRQIQLE